MALKKKESPQTLGESLGQKRKPDRAIFLLPTDSGESITLYARRIGVLEKEEILFKAHMAGRAGFSDLVAASIENEDGNRFTLEELFSCECLSDVQLELLQDKMCEANALGKYKKEQTEENPAGN